MCAPPLHGYVCVQHCSFGIPEWSQEMGPKCICRVTWKGKDRRMLEDVSRACVRSDSHA